MGLIRLIPVSNEALERAFLDKKQRGEVAET